MRSPGQTPLIAIAVLLVAGPPAIARGEPGTPAWTIPPPAAGGEISVASFNDFARRLPAAIRRAPLPFELAQRFVPNLARSAVGRISVAAWSVDGEAQTRAAAVVIRDRMFDDSVRAVRYRLGFSRTPNGAWTLIQARWDQRCWPGRGHQRFRPTRCI